MSEDLIYPGAVVRITNGEGFKTKPAGTLFDPNDVTLTLRKADGTVVDLSETVQGGGEDNVGLFHADYTVDAGNGRYWFTWNGDDVENQGYFDVDRLHTSDPVNPPLEGP